jgi:O-methyltransferase
VKELIKKLFFLLGFDITRAGRAPETVFESGGIFLSQYCLAQERTQSTVTDNHLRRERHHTLFNLVYRAHISSADVAECGCFRGLSAYQIASSLKIRGFKNIFYIFDSFEGLSEYGVNDSFNGEIKDLEKRRKHFACDENVVRANLREFDFIKYMKGWIPARFQEVSKRKFSFVHIDVDLYSPIKESLEFFYPRMIPGGFIVFDDYGCLAFPGAKKAVDEFMIGKPDFFLPFPAGEAFLIKA